MGSYFDAKEMNGKTREEKIAYLQAYREYLFMTFSDNANVWLGAFEELESLYRGIDNINRNEAFDYIIETADWTALDYADFILYLSNEDRYKLIKAKAFSKLLETIPNEDSLIRYNIYNKLANASIKNIDLTLLYPYTKFNPEKDGTHWVKQEVLAFVEKPPSLHRVWKLSQEEETLLQYTKEDIFALVLRVILPYYVDIEKMREKVKNEPAQSVEDAIRRLSINTVSIMDSNKDLKGQLSTEDAEFYQKLRVHVLSLTSSDSGMLYTQAGFWPGFLKVINQSIFFDFNNKLRIEQAAVAYKENRFGECLYLLLTVIEASLTRWINVSLVPTADKTIYDKSLLAQLLTGLKSQITNPELVDYWRHILIKREFLNIRNRLFHGIDFDLETKLIATLVFNIIFTMSLLIKIEEKFYLLDEYSTKELIKTIIENSKPYNKE